MQLFAKRPPLGLALAVALAAVSGAQATTVAEPRKDQEFKQAYVTKAVKVYAGPGSRHRVVNTLAKGDFVNVGECRGSWCYVDIIAPSGWIQGRHIGHGENPYHDLGPAKPGHIPPQEPGTRRID